MENLIEGKIVGYNGKFLTVAPLKPIDRIMEQQDVQTVEIRLNDGRLITAAQRRKIFALVRDIAIWSGHEPEYIRSYLKFDFCCKEGIEDFSLSSCDVSTAREFINYLIEFCFRFDVPTRETLLYQTDDISKYLYMCLEYRKCAVCSQRAEVHHVNRIGMGADREKVVHKGLKAIALCHKHHMEAHQREQEFFEENHIYGIRLDDYLCKKLNLNVKEPLNYENTRTKDT